MHNNCFAWLCFRQILLQIYLADENWIKSVIYYKQQLSYVVQGVSCVCVCVFYLILFKRQKYSKNWYTVCKSICFKYAIRHYIKYLETKSFAYGYVYINLDTFENRVFVLIHSPSTLTVSKSFSSTLKCQKTLNLPYCACVKSHKSNTSSLRLYRWNRHNEFSCNYSGRIIFLRKYLIIHWCVHVAALNHVWSKKQLPSCFAAGQKLWVKFLSSL